MRGVSFAVRAGEILGIAGLVGAGRTELARLIFGADRPEAGRILLDGRAGARSARRATAIGLGICLLTEDRKAQGLVPRALGAGELRAAEPGSLVAPAVDRRRARERRRSSATWRASTSGSPGRSSPRATSPAATSRSCCVARWLESDARVLLFDEPTRGIDVGAQHEMYLLIRRLAARGKAIVMISSDLPEVLGMSDRILVMRDGRVGGEIARARARDAGAGPGAGGGVRRPSA